MSLSRDPLLEESRLDDGVRADGDESKLRSNQSPVACSIGLKMSCNSEGLIVAFFQRSESSSLKALSVSGFTSAFGAEVGAGIFCC
jgi:hypothetical protein